MVKLRSSFHTMANSLYKERLNHFDEILVQSKVVDLKNLRDVCFRGGCPDVNHLRSLSWKLLLGYLSPDKEEWPTTLAKKRQVYKQFIDELILSDATGKQQDDHPLNPAPTSQWGQHFKDNEILLQIFKDVRRLYPDISFFQQRIAKNFTASNNEDKSESSAMSDEGCSSSSESSPMHKKATCDIIGRPSNNVAQSVDIVRSTFGAVTAKNSKGFHNCRNSNSCDGEDNFDELFSTLDHEEYHWQVVARILFIYAKLNPGSGYVQGMNEIIGPIYYVFSNDTRDDWSEHSEADTFWCFTELMSEIRDMYNSHLDSDRSTGVVAVMSKLSNLLSAEDADLYHQLFQVQAIKPHFYAFRWITLLLSQEFPLPEVLRIWDFLFADSDRFNFLIYICCSMILLVKFELMKGDFSANMKLLQNFPERIDVSSIITRAKILLHNHSK